MQESYWNRGSNQHKHEIFSQLQVPPDTPFFTRLDGRRFQAISEKIGAKKPFDKKLAKCLVASAKTTYKSDLNPALIYAASDEINALFSSKEGSLIQQILKWAKPSKGRERNV